MLHRTILTAAIAAAAIVTTAHADVYQLMTGVNAGNYPGADRAVFGSAPFPGTFSDGDRLAGTTDDGSAATWQGNGAPLFQPNQFGSLSFMYRRGSVNFGQGDLPIMGIEFLGGPLLDLDGDLNNGVRSVEPVADGGGGFESPAIIPDTSSFLDLTIDTAGGTIGLNNFDATGTNPGGANLPPEFGVTLNLLGSTPGSFAGIEATPGAPINTTDTRTGTLTLETGTSGTLEGVYRVEGLGYEVWQDSISGNTSTPAVGTFQFLGELSGFVIVRDENSGQFPTLTGEGLGSTIWPAVDSDAIGSSVNSAFGGSVTIGDGPAGDTFDGEGLPLTDFGGDIGAYLDWLITNADPLADQIVFLEAAGFGVNNSSDPVFGDTVSYDMVIVAQHIIPEPGAGLALLMGLVGVACRRTGRRSR